MALERLSFAPDSPYHSFEASLHLSRYLLAQELCRGRRVLDIACGEGYGTALLADWGAQEVVGADISADAVAAARRSFPRPNTRYVCADAVAEADPLAGEAPFDLIVSFETFEHVADPELLLRRLAGWRAPGGAIILSCPNDPAVLRLGFSNEFHLRTWTLAEFGACCKAVLGAADAWLLQTPCLGAMILTEADSRAEAAGSFLQIMQPRPVGTAQALPPQGNIAPSWDDSIGYVGIWGAVPPEQLVASPVSFSAYMEPWSMIGEARVPADTYAEALRRSEQLQARYDELAGAHRALLEQREQDRQQLLRYAAGVVIVAPAPPPPRTSLIVRLTGSPRLLAAYQWALRLPLLGCLLGKLRRAALRRLGRTP